MNGEVLYHRIIRRQHTRNQCPKTNCRSVGKIGPTNKGTNTQHLETYNHRRIQMFSKKTLCFLLNGCCALSSIPSQKCLWTLRSVSDAVNVSRPFSQQETPQDFMAMWDGTLWDSMGLYGTLWDSMGLWLPKISSLGLSGTSLHLRSALSGKDFLVETEEKISNRQVYQGMVGTKKQSLDLIRWETKAKTSIEGAGHKHGLLCSALSELPLDYQSSRG